MNIVTFRLAEILKLRRIGATCENPEVYTSFRQSNRQNWEV